MGRLQRFIPAPAGNGDTAIANSLIESVHPRACGERRTIIQAEYRDYGSSPRLRGTDRSLISGHRRFRFIPAPAGNGLYALAAPPLAPVHPRACGERLFAERSISRNSGSSPRLRGTE